MSQASIKALITQFSGQHNTLTLQRPYIEFCGGSVEGGLFLSQLLYWAERAGDDGWFYKPYKEWRSEIYVTEKQVRTWSKKFDGFLETANRRAPNGTPTLHYRVDWETFTAVFSEFLQGSNQGVSTIRPKGRMETAKRQNGNGQIDRMETANPPNGNGQIDRSRLYTSTTSSTTSSTTEEVLSSAPLVESPEPENRERGENSFPLAEEEFFKFIDRKLPQDGAIKNRVAYVRSVMKNDRETWIGIYLEEQEKRRRNDSERAELASKPDFVANLVEGVMKSSASREELRLKRENIRRMWEASPSKRKSLEEALKGQPELEMFVLDGQLCEFGSEVAA